MAARNNCKGTVHVLKISRNLGRALERYDIKYNFRVGQFHWYPVQYLNIRYLITKRSPVFV